MKSKLFCLAFLLFQALFAQSQTLKVGAAASDITPFLDQELAGYFYPRYAEGVHDPLLAKVLIFDDGQNEIVLVACDVIEIPRSASAEDRSHDSICTLCAPTCASV